MFEQELTYQKLQIPSLEIYEAMGYKDSMPDGMVIEEINTLLDRTTPLLRPRSHRILWVIPIHMSHILHRTQ